MQVARERLHGGQQAFDLDLGGQQEAGGFGDRLGARWWSGRPAKCCGRCWSRRLCFVLILVAIGFGITALILLDATYLWGTIISTLALFVPLDEGL